MACTVTTRVGSRVERERLTDLSAALDRIDERSRELAARANSKTVDLKLSRPIEPAEQVLARLELRGPRRLRAGIDVRGDGSSEAYTGRFRRRLIAQEGGETAAEALRRLVGSR